MMRFVLLIAILLFSASFEPATSSYTPVPVKQSVYNIFKNNGWVDSNLANMSVEQKIGQLFMIAAWSSPDKMNIRELLQQIEHNHIGGVIFFKGSPYKQAEITNTLQAKSRVPLLIGIDGEWGLSMRLDSTQNYGYQMGWGAVTEDSIVYRAGKEIARQCARLGIHINFAPVIDINNNPLNPVIHMRSFGEDKKDVTQKALMYMRGLQDEKILAVAKHFPGHGNTDVDSHLDLPVLNQTQKEMDTLELYPFKHLFAQGVGGVMTAHLHIPAYDSTPNMGASLSPVITTGLLKNKMNFKGLVFSDALNMRGVSKFYKPGELEVAALMAGNDILLYSENVPRATAKIKMAIDSGCISLEDLDDKVRRILQVKYWAGLANCKYVDMKNLTADLNNQDALQLKEEITKKAVTVVKNENQLLPLRNFDGKKYASVAVGTRIITHFQETIGQYNRHDYFTIGMQSADADYKILRDTLMKYDVVILSLHHLSNKKTSTYGLSQKAIDFVRELNNRKTTILINFGSPYVFSRFPDFKSIIAGYQDDAGFQSAAAHVLYGATTASARLPVTASEEYRRGQGLNTKGLNRLHYGLPDENGFSAEKLKLIDEVAAKAMTEGATPGMQVLVAKSGKIVYYKSFGYHTYNNEVPVLNSDIYDIASVTKVAATTLAAMKLYDEGKLNIHKTLSTYLPELSGTNKADLSIREVMAHQAGLQAWIPFYQYTLTPKGLCDTVLYCSITDSMFPVRVAEKLYLRQKISDSIYTIINNSEINGRGKYRYSDLGFMYMQKIIERITEMPLNQYVEKTFYQPLGLTTLSYLPRKIHPLTRIVPTEQDHYFRRQLVHGDVHDQAAAMMGGVAGHAGLFSNALDLAIVLQMLLDDGVYAGQRYLKPGTIKFFTSQQYDDNRKGLGWDKPTLDPSKGSPASKYASNLTYGHTGFTGTCVWADPKSDIVYIFLSNRVYPTAENNKLAKLNIRTDIHDAIYKALVNP